jgi:glycosyltransferase involved in cell wall biosynthesis
MFMLSVLIPVKNWNPLGLVESLAAQLVQSGQSYEILISDDSEAEATSGWVGTATGLRGASYFGREKSLGRSANRNFLASKAQYPYLLFIDGDAGMASDAFIHNYLQRLDPNTVLCGGTLYENHPPDDPDQLLRWTFGRKREQSPASERQKHPYRSFSTFNFLVPSAVFKSIRFEESITGYGHEDTLFGIRLQEEGISIIHLDNGLLHLGLEPALSYLDKTREAAAILFHLYESGILPPGYASDIRLLGMWRKLKSLQLTPLAALLFRYGGKSIQKQLLGANPSLFLLDLYKLGSISHIA